MRVAVTGAGGRLGRALVPALAADERVDEVIAIDLRPPQARAGVRTVACDVRDPGLAGTLEGADAVVHLAFRVLGRGRDAWSVNVDGSRNVFEAAARAGTGALVYSSSAAAYGCAADNPVPLTEDSPLRAEPPFYYTQTKVHVERLLDEHERRHPQMRVVRLRLAATLGPGAPVLVGGRLFVSPSDHDPLVQFVWIDDLVDLVRTVVLGDARGTFNVGAPGPVRSSDVARLLGVRSLRAPAALLRGAARAGSVLRLPGALHPAWVDMARYPIVVDAGRAERELGWRPGLDCSETLERYRSEVMT